MAKAIIAWIWLRQWASAAAGQADNSGNTVWRVQSRRSEVRTPSRYELPTADFRLGQIGHFAARRSPAILLSFPAAGNFDSEFAEMAKSKKKAETVFLVCEETGDHNYTLKRKPGGEKLKLMKYSPRVRKHTLHAEKKK
jgi:large subunit ribosomal protein L33